MTGKEKCHLLREIRREIARVNNIPYQPDDCNYPGDDCPGTCPKCDAEIRALETMLNRKADRGERITLAGISLETYQKQAEPDPFALLEIDDNMPTGILEYVDDDPTGLVDIGADVFGSDAWNSGPGLAGVMMEVDPKREIPVKELRLPMLMRQWLAREYIEKTGQLQDLVKYQPERLTNKNRSWYEAAVRELNKLGLDVSRPEPQTPPVRPYPDDIKGGRAELDDIPDWF